MHPYALAFAVYDPELRKVVELDAKVLGQDASRPVGSDTLAAWLGEHEALDQVAFSRVRAALHSPAFTIVPEHSDNPRAILEALGYDSALLQRTECRELQPGFHICYALPQAAAEFLEHRFHHTEFQFGDAGILRFQNPRLSFRNHLLAHLYGEDLSLALKTDGQLRFFNKFTAKSKEDLLYYIRLAYEQLGLDPNEFATYVYGFIEEKSPAFSTSYGFLRNFEIDRTLKHGLGYIYTDEQLPLHYYINLLALGPCV